MRLSRRVLIRQRPHGIYCQSPRAEIFPDMAYKPDVTITDGWRLLSRDGLRQNPYWNARMKEHHEPGSMYTRLFDRRTLASTGYSLVDANMMVLATATAGGQTIAEIDDTNLFAMNFLSFFKLIVDVESALIDAHNKALTTKELANAD
jgi:hypothetical protein